jgi:hypothetical protein
VKSLPGGFIVKKSFYISGASAEIAMMESGGRTAPCFPAGEMKKIIKH